MDSELIWWKLLYISSDAKGINLKCITLTRVKVFEKVILRQ